jgi:hypothetical protein
MKINEIIREASMNKNSREAIPDMETWPQLDNNNSPYAAYRFGVAMAGAPDMKTDKRGPIGGKLITIGYTEADDEILKAAAKEMGVAPQRETERGSTEREFVNTTSPVRAKKKNRYGV